MGRPSRCPVSSRRTASPRSRAGRSPSSWAPRSRARARRTPAGQRAARSTVSQPLGPGTASATFAGDAYYLPSSDSKTTLIYATAPGAGGGAFVIGDQNTTGTVNFWGSQWSTTNKPSGGAAPSAFKGYRQVPGVADVRHDLHDRPGQQRAAPKRSAAGIHVRHRDEQGDQVRLDHHRNDPPHRHRQDQPGLRRQSGPSGHGDRRRHDLLSLALHKRARPCPSAPSRAGPSPRAGPRPRPSLAWATHSAPSARIGGRFRGSRPPAMSGAFGSTNRQRSRAGRSSCAAAFLLVERKY